MKQTIGVIGAAGDLGGQLVGELRRTGVAIMMSDPLIAGSSSVRQLVESCDIIHVCAPLEQVEVENWSTLSSVLIVLHDSTMDTSRRFSNAFVNGRAGIVHLLMNKHKTAVIADDTENADRVEQHMSSLGFTTKRMTIDAHDRLMANSQAPLALLCQVLLPSLTAQDEAGMLTTSGEDLIKALKKRQAAWTPQTIQSILRNPQLPHLIDDMQLIMAEIGYNKR